MTMREREQHRALRWAYYRDLGLVILTLAVPTALALLTHRWFVGGG